MIWYLNVQGRWLGKNVGWPDRTQQSYNYFLALPEQSCGSCHHGYDHQHFTVYIRFSHYRCLTSVLFSAWLCGRHSLSSRTHSKGLLCWNKWWTILLRWWWELLSYAVYWYELTCMNTCCISSLPLYKDTQNAMYLAGLYESQWHMDFMGQKY